MNKVTFRATIGIRRIHFCSTSKKCLIYYLGGCCCGSSVCESFLVCICASHIFGTNLKFFHQFFVFSSIPHSSPNILLEKPIVTVVPFDISLVIDEFFLEVQGKPCLVGYCCFHCSMARCRANGGRWGSKVWQEVEIPSIQIPENTIRLLGKRINRNEI